MPSLFFFWGESEEVRRAHEYMQVARYGNVPPAVNTSMSPHVAADPIWKQLEAVPSSQLDVFVRWAGLGHICHKLVQKALSLAGYEKTHGI